MDGVWDDAVAVECGGHAASSSSGVLVATPPVTAPPAKRRRTETRSAAAGDLRKAEKAAAVFRKFSQRHASATRVLPRDCGFTLAAVSAGLRECAEGTWLDGTIERGQFHWGCLACKARRAQLPKAMFTWQHCSRKYACGTLKCKQLNISNVKRHQRVRWHRDACLLLLGLDEGDGGGDPTPCTAPPSDHFVRLVTEVRKGSAVRPGLAGIGSARKLAKMRFVVAEAVKGEQRCWMQDVECITLIRDERQGQLVVRARATNSHLDTRTFVLGCMRDFGSGALKITQATHDIIKEFCTPGFGASRHRCLAVEAPALDDGLYQRILAKVEALAVDSAADEIRSGESMRSDAASLTKNLRVLLRDKAHGMRRTFGDHECCHIESSVCRSVFCQSVSLSVHQSTGRPFSQFASGRMPSCLLACSPPIARPRACLHLSVCLLACLSLRLYLCLRLCPCLCLCHVLGCPVGSVARFLRLLVGCWGIARLVDVAPKHPQPTTANMSLTNRLSDALVANPPGC